MCLGTLKSHAQQYSGLIFCSAFKITASRAWELFRVQGIEQAMIMQGKYWAHYIISPAPVIVILQL